MDRRRGRPPNNTLADDTFVGSAWNTRYGQLAVIERAGMSANGMAKYRVRFTTTGTERVVYKSVVVNDQIKDPYAKTVLGVACCGNAGRVNNNPLYFLWHNIVSRCYNPIAGNNYKQYGAKGVRMCERWLCFEYFLADVERVPGWPGLERLSEYNLDKDTHGGMLYSLDTCVWLPAKINSEMGWRTQQRRASKQIEVTRSDGSSETFPSAVVAARHVGIARRTLCDMAQYDRPYKDGTRARYTGVRPED